MSEVSQKNDFVAQHDPKSIANSRACGLGQLSDISGGRTASVHKEVGMHARYLGAADAMALQPGAIDERACRVWHPVRQYLAAGHGILKHAAGTGQRERLRALTMCQGRSRDGA